MKLVDSRYRERGPTPLVDSISDAASCGFVVLGGCPRRLTAIDVRRIGASLTKNGEVEESGVSSAVMGNPINSVAWLANKVHQFGVKLEAGHVILPGSCTRAVDVKAGDVVTAEFSGLGSVTISFH